jgi:hypothetical protein
VLYNITIAWFDIMVTDTIPADDFDINTLTHQINNDKFEARSYGTKTEEVLKRCIVNKRDELLATYVARMSSDCYATQRLERRYINKGWIICYKNEMFDNATKLQIFCLTYKNGNNHDKLKTSGYTEVKYSKPANLPLDVIECNSINLKILD